MLAEYVFRVRDVGERHDEDQVFVAECSCGWVGSLHEGVWAKSAARRDGQRHIDIDHITLDERQGVFEDYGRMPRRRGFHEADA